MYNPFNNNEFNSGDGMLTSVWGPSMWHTLHTISFNYPVNPKTIDKTNYMKFFLSLKNILPCKYCRINYVKNLKSVPLNIKVMKNRNTLSKWLYLFSISILIGIGEPEIFRSSSELLDKLL